MEKTTGTAKVTMEAFGEKFEQTGSAVIAFVIKPDGREEGTMSMAMGGGKRQRHHYSGCEWSTELAQADVQRQLRCIQNGRTFYKNVPGMHAR